MNGDKALMTIEYANYISDLILLSEFKHSNCDKLLSFREEAKKRHRGSLSHHHDSDL